MIKLIKKALLKHKDTKMFIFNKEKEYDIEKCIKSILDSYYYFADIEDLSESYDKECFNTWENFIEMLEMEEYICGFGEDDKNVVLFIRRED